MKPGDPLQPSSVDPARAGTPNVSGELKQLWISILRERWSSLVVVPTGRGVSSRPITGPLGEIARHCSNPLVEVFDAEGASLDMGERFVDVLAAAMANGARVIAGVAPLTASLSGVPLVLSADAALLVVGVGTSELSAARRTIDSIGRDRVIGCVALGPGLMSATAPGA